jgi:hypothetical protein
MTENIFLHKTGMYVRGTSFKVFAKVDDSVLRYDM